MHIFLLTGLNGGHDVHLEHGQLLLELVDLLAEQDGISTRILIDHCLHIHSCHTFQQAADALETVVLEHSQGSASAQRT